MAGSVSRLSPSERLCVSLCHGAGLTQDEIAQAKQKGEAVLIGHLILVETNDEVLGEVGAFPFGQNLA